MGWSESPPFFCSAAETARDIIQLLADNNDKLPKHPLEQYLLPQETQQHTNNNTTTCMEVYVDDFIAMTNNINTENLTNWSRAILHGVHSIFPPPSVTGHTGGDPVSIKKLNQGDGRWDNEKEILGWIFNGKEYSIKLPSTKIETLRTILKQAAKKKTMTLQDFQKIAGKLVHASIGIPLGASLLSAIYKGLQTTSDFITITNNIKQSMKDWRFLLSLLDTRPTSILELTPGMPWFIAYTDASNTGAGGVWTNDTKELKQHIVWRAKWPADITNSIISEANPKGTLT